MGNFEKFVFDTLEESPDNFKFKGKHIDHTKDDTAITFSIFGDYGVYGPTNKNIYHAEAVGLYAGEEFFEDYPHAKWFPSEAPAQERIKLYRILDKYAEDTAGLYRTAGGRILAGRVFPKYKVVSFWNRTTEVVASASVLLKFMEHLGYDPSEWSYEMIDKREPIPFKGSPKASENPTSDKDLSQDEIDELMKVQHLDPNAKKKLRKNAGYTKSKLPLGWNVFSRMSDSVEKEGEVVEESEDIPVVKLSGFGRKIDDNSPAEKLIKAFNRNTDPNPLSAASRVTSDNVVVELTTILNASHEVMLKYIHSLDKRRGAGTQTLKNIMFLADKHDVDIRVFPKPLGDDAMSAEDLEEWYFKNGFRYHEKGEMIYRAKSED